MESLEAMHVRCFVKMKDEFRRTAVCGVVSGVVEAALLSRFACGRLTLC